MSTKALYYCCGLYCLYNFNLVAAHLYSFFIWLYLCFYFFNIPFTYIFSMNYFLIWINAKWRQNDKICEIKKKNTHKSHNQENKVEFSLQKKNQKKNFKNTDFMRRQCNAYALIVIACYCFSFPNPLIFVYLFSSVLILISLQHSTSPHSTAARLTYSLPPLFTLLPCHKYVCRNNIYECML